MCLISRVLYCCSRWCPLRVVYERMFPEVLVVCVHKRMTEGVQYLMARHIFITGQPGVGKTTLVVAAVRARQDVCGFYTAERRSGSERSGFDVVALGPSASEVGTLATVGKGKYMVGKYSIDVPSFESIALPSLKSATATPITVIDEVGKMELFSLTFLPRVESMWCCDRAWHATHASLWPQDRCGRGNTRTS